MRKLHRFIALIQHHNPSVAASPRHSTLPKHTRKVQRHGDFAWPNLSPTNRKAVFSKMPHRGEGVRHLFCCVDKIR
jgi:hypothetical protein